MLKQRVITALLLLPLVGLVLFVVDLRGFAATLLIVAYLMAWEWARLSSIETGIYRSLYALGVALSALAIWYVAPAIEFWPAPFWYLQWHWDSTLIAYWLAFGTWLLAIALILTSPKTNRLWNATPWARLLLGLIIIIGFWISAIALRSTSINEDFNRGAYMVLLMLLIIWGADVGGYVFGKWLGRHKLAPTISPGKTWEGFIGGVVTSLLVAFGGAYTLQLPIGHYGLFLILMMMLVVVSVFGDLFVSLLKRQVNLKDTSNLLPGHGGVLDRLDSTLAVAPFFLLVARTLEWIQ
jgi:phosphatidate cytidylyltransferase